MNRNNQINEKQENIMVISSKKVTKKMKKYKIKKNKKKCNNIQVNSSNKLYSNTFELIISKETTSQILGKLNNTSFFTFSFLSSIK